MNHVSLFLLTFLSCECTDESSPPQSTGDTVPLCRGLIHRTEAGWKHCMERFAAKGSKIVSTQETMDAFKEKGELEKKDLSFRGHDDNMLNNDEYDHFYYFDGVLKRVRSNFYPYRKIQGRRKRSNDNSESSVTSKREKGDTHENLLSYIRRLTLRNKVSHSK